MAKKTKKRSESNASKEASTADKQSKLFFYVIAFIIIFIVLVLSIRYFVPEKSEVQSYSYNGFVFTNITGLWFTDIQKTGTNTVYTVPLRHGPRELQDIAIEGDVTSFKNRTKLYITFDPTGEDFTYIALAASELSINLAQTLNITPVAACSVNDTEVCAGRPIINCKTHGEAAIYLKYANDTRVYAKNNCIFLEGPEEEIMKSADRLLLKWFSVMP